MSKNILLISDQVLKDRTPIHGNIDPKLLYPDIKFAQDGYILPILGTALYNKILDDINSNTLSGDYLYLHENYIIDTLIYYVMAQLPDGLSFQFWNKGVVRKMGENTEMPSMSDLMTIAAKYKSRAEYYQNRLKLYLLASISMSPPKFPEYMLPGTTVDTVTPEMKSFSSPIYLGDSKRNPWCNEGGFTPEPYHD